MEICVVNASRVRSDGLRCSLSASTLVTDIVKVVAGVLLETA